MELDAEQYLRDVLLLVSRLVLPSVLRMVTRSRTGAERESFLDLIGVTPDAYEPHSRETALLATSADAAGE